MNRWVQALSITLLACFLTTTSASGANISFNSNEPDKGFTRSSCLAVNSNLCAPATLAFIPDSDLTVSTAVIINFGVLSLLFSSCDTLADGLCVIDPCFIFNLLIPELTDWTGARFEITSSGNIVCKDLSQLTVNWWPRGLGTSSSFRPDSFAINQTSWIVPPNSGPNDGEMPAQGSTVLSAVSEPVTFGLVGCALIGLVVMRRQRS